MIGISGTVSSYRFPLIMSVAGAVIAAVVIANSEVVHISGLFLVILEAMLLLSLFMPGYFIQSLISKKFLQTALSPGEQIAGSLALSLFTILGLGLLTSTIGWGLRESFYAYFTVSSMLLVIAGIMHRNWMIQAIRSMKKKRKLGSSGLALFALLFMIVPLFHLYGFAKLNWDGFNFYLRDAMAIVIANSVSNHYPSTFYAGDVPLIFNSFTASIAYSYGLILLNIPSYDGSIPALMEFTNISMTFVVIATLLATCFLLRSYARTVFDDKYMTAATVIIFLTTPLLTQFLYVWSLYGDLFFAFETLLVLVFAHKYLGTSDKQSRHFYLLMMVLGISLALATKTYGYLLILVMPLIWVCSRWIPSPRRGQPKHLDIASEDDPLRKYQSRAKRLDIEQRRTRESRVNHLLGVAGLFCLFGLVLAFGVSYSMRNIMLMGSPFGYTVEALVNRSESEVWANSVINSSAILQSVENYPPLNQLVSLLLSYGFFPVLIVPFALGMIFILKRRFSAVGIIPLYILCFYVMFATVLELRVDRHLFSLIALLPVVYVSGLRIIAEYLNWKKEGVLYAAMIASLMQLPILDAIYIDFKLMSIFPSMYYWYTADNLFGILSYSLISFGVATLLTHFIVASNSKRVLVPLVSGSIFTVMVIVIISTPLVFALNQHDSYDDYIDMTYRTQHLSFPLVLQEFIKIHESEGGKLVYLHGMGTEFLTLGQISYLKMDDFRMLAQIQDIVQERDPRKVHDLLVSKDIKYILFPSENNAHYRKVMALSGATNEALIFSDPLSVSSQKIQLNALWDLYVV